MLRRALLLFFIHLPWLAMAQPYWMQALGGLGNDRAADIKTDTDGSIYVTGEFSGTINIGGQNYVSSGSLDFFIARFTADGEVVWFKHGGGSGIDRGRALAIGPEVVAMAGDLMGAATFQGSTINSAGGTTDMFVAVVNKADGTLVWIRHGGGAQGADLAHGVSISADGRVSVAGEFRGTATWGASSLTSMTDPLTSQPSSDVFIASYSSLGSLLWLKQGTAKHADRAVAMVAGSAGELYVTGQYSDTITFDQTHPNILQNASFLLRLDAEGNEVWFRRFGGAGYNHVNDLVKGPDGNLKLVGDLQGNMTYSGNAVVNINSPSPFAYYLLSVTTNGELEGQTTLGSGNGLTGRALAVSGAGIAVLGEFNCRFDGASDHYGAQGIFMATGTEDLFISKHALAGMALQEAQQYGGRSGRSAEGIAYLPGGDLVFCGSFQENLLFPSLPGVTADISTGNGTLEGVWSSLQCDDENYGSYAGVVSAGLNDGFLGRAYVEGREPYDWWARLGFDCDREPLEPCIRQMGSFECSDTLNACGSITIEVGTRFSHSITANAHYLGPQISYLWSNGSTAPTITVNSSGTYTVTISSINGCWQWTDQIQVDITTPPPVPLISDDTGANVAEAFPIPITACDLDTPWVWAVNASDANEFWWNLPNSTEDIYTDSIQVDAAGTYTFVMSNGENCVSLISIDVAVHVTAPMPDIELLGSFNFYQATNDSISFCDGNVIQYLFTPTMLIDGVPSLFPEDLTVTWSHAPFFPQAVTGNGAIPATLDVFGNGWYTATLNFMVANPPCGDDSLLFSFSDSVYVTVTPTTVTDVSIIGTGSICDGATTVLSAICSACTSLLWGGPQHEPISLDSILISMPGTYSVAASLTNEFGCSFTEMAYFVVTIPTGITVAAQPSDGIICPGSNASVSTVTPGTDHLWYGPTGLIEGAGGTLFTDVPGEYFLIMDVGGCAMTSNSVTLTNYAAPYLITEPADVLCGPDDQITIQVVAAANAQLEWQAPLSGNSPVQVVNEAGTYTCLVNGCGVTIPLSVTVLDAPIVAELLTPGPFTICPGDSVLLEGAPGGDSYTWLPVQSTGSTLWATDAGTYDLVVQNAAGCADTASVSVSVIQFDEPLMVTGDTICSGEVAQLSASGSGTLTWYEDEAMTTVIGNGPLLSLQPTATVLVFIQQADAGCTPPPVAVEIHVVPMPEELLIEGPGMACAGEDVLLYVQASSDAELHWTTPTGPMIGSEALIENSTSENGGVYLVSSSLLGCTGPSSSHTLTIVDAQAIGLSPIQWFCVDEPVTLVIPPSFTDIQWSNGSTAAQITVASPGELYVSAIDPQGCMASTTVELVEEDCELVIPNVFTPNGDGMNDTWLPVTSSTGSLARIFNRWGNLIYEGDVLVRPWNGKVNNSGERCADGVYYFELELKRANGNSTMHTGYVHLSN